jgi:UDP-glucose 4-epimerase
VPKRPGEPDCTWADIGKISKELNWAPQVDFADGVGRMLKVIDYWKQAPVWDTHSIEKATRTWFAYMKE